MRNVVSKIGSYAYAISVILLIILIVSIAVGSSSAMFNLVLGYSAFALGTVGIVIKCFNK